MITGLPGFLLNSFSIILLSAIVIILLTSLVLATNAWYRMKLSAEDRAGMLWLVVLSPWMVGLLATFIVVAFSQPALSIPLNNKLIHWHHLSEFYVSSWHGFLVLTMVALGVVLLARVVLRVIVLNQATTLLTQFSGFRTDGMLELDSDSYAAFTAGIRKPQGYITRALLDELDPLEYEIIRNHELSHVQSRDPARKAWFQILTGFYPAGISRFLRAQMVIVTEQIADSQVVQICPDKASIARALLKVQRLCKQSPLPISAALNVCHFGADSIEQRINYLLSDNKNQPLSLPLVFSTIAILSLGCALGADSLHHAIELTLQHQH